MEKVEKIALGTPGVAHTIFNPGRSFVLNAVSSNLGSTFVPLKPFHERRNPALRADAITARLRRRFQREVPEARVNVFGAPAVDGLGTAGGFRLMVRRQKSENRGQKSEFGTPKPDL
jgi:multidrug efflux pump